MSKRALDNVDKKTMKASGWNVHAGDPDKMVVLAKASYSGDDTTIMHSTKAVEVRDCERGKVTGCVLEAYSEVDGIPVKAVVWIPKVSLDDLKAAYGSE